MKGYTKILPNGDTETDCYVDSLSSISEIFARSLALMHARDAWKYGRYGTRHTVLASMVAYVVKHDGIWRHKRILSPMSGMVLELIEKEE